MTLFIALSLLSLIAVANLATLPVMFGVRAPDDNDIVKEDTSIARLEREKEILKIQQDQALAQNDFLRGQKASQDIRMKAAEIERAKLKELQTVLAMGEEARAAEITALNEKLKALEANAKNEAEILAIQQKIKAINIGTNAEIIKALETQEAITASTDQAAKNIEEQSGTLNDIFGTMLGIREGQKNILVEAMKTAKANGGISKQLGDARVTITNILSPMNIMASLGSKIFESTVGMAIAQDSALANLNKSVGAMGQFNDAANEAFLASREFGVGYAEAAGAVQALHSSMADFTELSETAQKELTNFTAQMSQLGIESSTTAASLNIATKSLGLGVGEAQNMQKELFATAQAIGVAPKQLAEGFVSASPQLAAHGDKMIEVFKEMAGAAKATGIEMSALLQIAGQFDTFEGAAQAAGNLNAILGGDLLNSVELLAATEEERIRMLIQSIQLSGKIWESMNKFERQAIASAAGITDMNIANQMFNQSLSAYDSQVTKSKQSAISQKKMNEAMKEFADIGQKVKAAVMSLAVSIRPLIELMRLVLEGFALAASAATALDESIVPVIVGLFALGAAIYFGWRMIQMWKAAVVVATAVQGAASGTAAAAATASATAIGVQSAAMATATPVFLAFGAASGAASAGVGMFALAILAIGAAIALAGAGIAAIFVSIGYMFGKMSELAGGQIIELSVGMLALAASMMAFSALGGPVGLFAAIGVAMLVGLMLAAVATASSFGTIATSINSIKTAIDGLNETKLEALTMTMGVAAVAAPAFAIAAAPLAAIAGTTGTITAAANRGVVSKATPATGAPGAAGGGGGGVDQRPIQLMVDHRGKKIIAEIATEALAKDINSAARSDRNASPRSKLVTSPA